MYEDFARLPRDRLAATDPALLAFNNTLPNVSALHPLSSEYGTHVEGFK